MDFIPIDIKKRKNLNIRPGSTVRVWVKIEEKGKTRLQAFEGLVLARKHGAEPGATFTVRKMSGSVGVERIFPLYSPNIDKIEILKQAKTRRSKLYYIRNKAAKEIRRKIKQLKTIMKKRETKDEERAETDNNQFQSNEGEKIKKETKQEVAI